jgi:hypothetical protein
MPDFEIQRSQYEDVPDLLVEMVPGFEDSPEFALVADNRELPDVVLGALARFVVRVETTSATGSLDEDAASRAGAYQAIETLAASADPHVVNGVVVGVFEVLDATPRVLATIEQSLLPKSRELYERWIGPIAQVP